MSWDSAPPSVRGRILAFCFKFRRLKKKETPSLADLDTICAYAQFLTLWSENVAPVSVQIYDLGLKSDNCDHQNRFSFIFLSFRDIHFLRSCTSDPEFFSCWRINLLVTSNQNYEFSRGLTIPKTTKTGK